LSMICEEFPDLHYGGKRGGVDFERAGFDSDWMNAIMGQDQDVVNMMMPSTDVIVPANTQMDSSQNSQKTPLWMTMMYPQGYGFRSTTGRNDMIPPRFRKSPRGIVDECCLQPCSLKQLMAYCKTVVA
ncbi:uncharacterized protein LOC129760121, partial [Uranotaenia lowii]|uniref:uncharacterized protein LOC129760121 n=1 Tax=Uranotaenia lowii TaxID=190385 RepID=UPI00247B18B7